MIDTMWVAQAAQSGDVAGVGASDFFGNTAQMLENGFTLIVSLFASPFLDGRQHRFILRNSRRHERRLRVRRMPCPRIVLVGRRHGG